MRVFSAHKDIQHCKDILKNVLNHKLNIPVRKQLKREVIDEEIEHKMTILKQHLNKNIEKSVGSFIFHSKSKMTRVQSLPISANKIVFHNLLRQEFRTEPFHLESNHAKFQLNPLRND